MNNDIINALNIIDDISIYIDIINDKLIQSIKILEENNTNNNININNKKKNNTNNNIENIYIRTKNFYQTFKNLKNNFDTIHKKNINYIKNNCVHEWENDWIETNLDNMVPIKFCKKCYYTENTYE